MRFKNSTHLLIGYKACARKPPAREMAIVVRGKYDLRDAGRSRPLRLCRSEAISDKHIATAAAANAKAGEELRMASILLGQGTLRGESFREDDERRQGAPIYPGDFADFKLNAEVLAHAVAYADRDASECEIELGVGTWSKKLRVLGPRVRTDNVAGGGKTKPQPIGQMAIDHAHAYGGPGFANNPVGKGFIAAEENAAGAPQEDMYQPPRSERSRVMPTMQLPNVLHADGAETKAGFPASYAAISSQWQARRGLRGKKYDQEWQRTRAPYPAIDFDFRYFHAAPPDQQLPGYLRGDEEIRIVNMLPHTRKLVVRLPGFRLRAFVLDDKDRSREVVMQLDTLYLDSEEQALYVTWRGHTPVSQEDLTDIKFGLVASEPLAERPQPVSDYEAQLRAFAVDPIGMNDAVPEGFSEFSGNVERLEEASDEELDAMADDLLKTDDEGGPFGAAMAMIFGPMLPPQTPEAKALAKKSAARMSPADQKTAVLNMLRQVGAPAGAVGLSPDTGKPVAPIGQMMQQLSASVAATTPPNAEMKATMATELQRLKESRLGELDANFDPTAEGGTDEPGPGANLANQDLSDRDLRGVSLSGANLEGATLSRTNLAGCDLSNARMAAAVLYKTDLTDTILTGVDLSMAALNRVAAAGARFDNAVFKVARATRCDFTGASFGQADLSTATFSKCTLDRSYAEGIRLHRTVVRDCSLVDANLRSAHIERCDVHECKCTGLKLDSATLVWTGFFRCDLSNASVRAAYGDNAVFMGSSLRKADFGMASMPNSHFFEVDAAGASFLRANVPDSRFDRAILRKADFSHAKLSGCNLRQAVLTDCRFVNASLYDATLDEAHGSQVDFAGANLVRTNFQRSEIERR